MQTSRQRARLMEARLLHFHLHDQIFRLAAHIVGAQILSLQYCRCSAQQGQRNDGQHEWPWDDVEFRIHQPIATICVEAENEDAEEDQNTCWFLQKKREENEDENRVPIEKRIKAKHLLAMVRQMNDTFVISHSYCKTIFNGHRTNSSAKRPNVKNVRMNAMVMHACTKSSQAGTRYSRMT